MNSLQGEQRKNLHVHTENIPQVVKMAIGKAFYEVYRSYDTEKREKEQNVKRTNRISPLQATAKKQAYK